MSITYNFEFDNSKFETFSDFADKVFEEVMKCGRDIIKRYLKEADEEILATRDKKLYRCKGERSTSVKTKLGVIEYERRIYQNTESKEHVFLLDENILADRIGLVERDMCREISEMACIMPYRKVAEVINSTTGLYISHQAVWDIVQKEGREEIENIEELSKLSNKKELIGSIDTKILYEESDGDWLKLQGRDRKKYGTSKEMKIGIAYDGVIYHAAKDGTKRRELDNKTAYASFETVKDFSVHKEAVIASKYNVDEIELRVKNGDGANWIQKNDDCECICVLDEYHRNKKITECVRDKKIAEALRELLFSGQYSDLLDTIEAYSNSIEDEAQVSKLKELYSYYSENFDALPDYYSRGIKIPQTREPGVIHHARLGSMESNVFTLIGNRMKGGRACWSIKGGNNLAALLCRYHTSGASHISANSQAVSPKQMLSSAKIPQTTGKGYEYPHIAHISPANKAVYNLVKQ